ncbi:amidohydrolase family protein [Fulvivirga sp.]|uniref:amidohydrolase family protein n=1 Tax=Fulvivirga sp. TaxID=1931237 RepID=UPI0032EDF2C0
MKRIYIYIIAFLVTTQLVAQVPQPVGPQSQPILLKGGIAHLGNGQVINNSIVGFENDKLTIVADASSNADVSKYKVVDITGQHVYPGFILPDSQLGIAEVSSIRAMDDTDEVGDMSPNVRSLVAYNTDSKVPPTLRYNGIMVAESTPTGGRISGTSSAMNLEGWNWEDAALKADIAVHMNWPSRMSRRFDFATFSVKREPNKDYSNQVDEVDAFFKSAFSYSKLASKERNLKLEAMGGLFTGEKVLMIHANGAKDIIESVKLAQANSVKKIAVVAGVAALDVSEFLATNNIPVILPNVHDLPDGDDMDVYLPFKLPGLLTKAGVTVALSHNGMIARARNLPFYAGSCVAYGMEKEAALSLITANPAKILGIDSEVGTLEVGKRATLFVSKGDALDMMTNNLSHGFIDGKEIVLDNEQQMLFERYSEKYSKK